VAASAGDPEKFAALFERHAHAVHAFLARRSPAHVADDLLGDVFSTAFEIRSRYDPVVDDARPWLFGIARNLLQARLRSDRRLLAAAARLPVDRPHDDWAQVDERLDVDASAKRVRRALEKLPESEREVLELVAWEGLSPTQAAATLGIPAPTARTRLHRARTTLRAYLSLTVVTAPAPPTTGSGHPNAPRPKEA
jgi:RNA polymerase sigma-70 factor (ECF subfamily)